MPVKDQEVTDSYAVYNADCMEVLAELKDNSIDLSIYSPPFPELYQYSDDPRDMTNCVSYNESIEQYRYIVKEVARVTKPGRMSCVHCTDLKRGQLYQFDFPGDVIRVHEEAGLRFFSRITIWKDAWEFARRTRMATLMHKTLTEDSSCSRTAPPDYLIVFKNAGKNEVPITHPKGLRLPYIGDAEIPSELLRDFANYRGDPRTNSLSHWMYRQYASPVWMDIRRGRFVDYEDARESDEEKHVCPLQLDVIERSLLLWSNPGETTLTPFMGAGSEVVGSILSGRKPIGIELKDTYYRQSRSNARRAVEQAELARETPLTLLMKAENEEKVELTGASESATAWDL